MTTPGMGWFVLASTATPLMAPVSVVIVGALNVDGAVGWKLAHPSIVAIIVAIPASAATAQGVVRAGGTKTQTAMSRVTT